MNHSDSSHEVLEVIGRVLIRCFFMGVVVLLFWWGMLLLSGDLAYSIHGKLFSISPEQFHVIHYAGILVTKIAIFVLFFLPYIAIRLVIGKRAS